MREPTAEPTFAAVPVPGGLPASRAVPRWARGPFSQALLRTLHNRMGAFGLSILALLIVVAAGAPVLAPYHPNSQHDGDELVAPGRASYLLGTDELGRDILSRIIWGARVSLLVGLIAVAVGAGIGVPTGLAAGYFGGWLDGVIMRCWDALLAFPGILTGIAVVSVLGPGALNVALALAIVNVPEFSRLTRACVLRERERDYILAARCLGGSDRRLIGRHLVPNCLPPLLVQLSLSMGFAVLLEASLSFLGLGTQAPDPSWGSMLNDSRTFLRQAPWYGIFPGVALAILLVGLNYLSDALRLALDPRRINTT
jgi:ABC-type dipeptide/oligopeptide/nickel transport system permease subunit